MNNDGIKLDLSKKIKIDLYSAAENNLFLKMLRNEDIEYIEKAKEFAGYLEKIKDDIEITNFNISDIENDDNFGNYNDIKKITKIIEYLNYQNNPSPDYINKKFDYINKKSDNDGNNKINFPIIKTDDIEFKGFKQLFEFGENNEIFQIDSGTYILPFILPIRDGGKIKWDILCFKKKNENGKNNEIYNHFIFIDDKNVEGEEIWKEINLEKIFNELDLICDYRYFDKELIEIYSKKISINKIGNSSKFLSFIKDFIEKKGGIEKILMNYKDSIDGIDFSSNTWEKHILGLTSLENLMNRDLKRCILGTVPFAKYVFETILNSAENEIEINTEMFSLINPFKQKYKGTKLNSLEEKFECLRDYINENSFAKDAANIGGMSGATDFLQLYNCINDEGIIKKENKEEIITKLFEVLKSKNIDEFINNYDEFIKILKNKNINDDKKLIRLYNRLYFVFSFVLNNLKPEEFPIYFSATRSTFRVFGMEGYINVTKFYKEFLKNENFKKYIDIYLNGVGINENNYFVKDLGEIDKEIIPYNETLFIHHAKYRFFQDLCRVLSRQVLDGQDYINNLGPGAKFIFDELKNKKYFGETTFGEILNIDYLVQNGYIKYLGNGEYQIIEIDDYFIRDKK